MHDFPFDRCPAASELHALRNGKIQTPDVGYPGRLQAHVDDCAHCSRAMEQLESLPDFDADSFARPPLDPAADQVARTLLRQALASVTERPAPGEVWLTAVKKNRHAWAETAERWMVFVLDRYYREYTQEWAFDVLPVTETDVGPADWTYVVPQDSSDWGASLAVHIDFHFSCATPALTRRLTRISEPCVGELRAGYEQFRVGLDAPTAPECGDFGTLWRRRSTEWREFEEAVYDLIAEASLQLPADEPTVADRKSLSSATTPFRSTLPGSVASHDRCSPTTPFRPGPSATFNAAPTCGVFEQLEERRLGGRTFESLYDMVDWFQASVRAGQHRPSNPRVRFDISEDLACLRQVRPLDGRPSTVDIIYRIKQQTGCVVSPAAALLIAEAHVAADPQTMPGQLQRAARKAWSGESGV